MSRTEKNMVNETTDEMADETVEQGVDQPTLDENIVAPTGHEVEVEAGGEQEEQTDDMPST